MSESQERMCAIVRPDKIDDFMSHCRKWDVEAVVIGEVNDSGRLTIDWHGERIVDAPPRTVAHEGPVYERPFHRPSWQDALQADEATTIDRPGPEEFLSTLLELVASANLADKSWVTDQYDRYVQGKHSPLAARRLRNDSGRRRIRERRSDRDRLQRTLREARSLRGRPVGARGVVSERLRHRSRPARGDQLLELRVAGRSRSDVAIRRSGAGLADACAALGIPVTGGNVSFYNQTGDTAIVPTPVVGVLGVIDDVDRRTPMSWGPDGELIYLLGDTRDEFSGSEWAHIRGHLGGLPPLLDLQREKVLGEILVAASRDGMITAAHDVSDGGFAIAVVEMALRSRVGARLWLPDDVDPFVQLFAESAGRAVVVIPRSEELRFTEMCAARGVPASRVGVVDSVWVLIPDMRTAPRCCSSESSSRCHSIG